MKYNHKVKHGGKWYKAGEEVPDSVPAQTSSAEYTKTDINRMPTAQLRELALSKGVEGAQDMTGAELKQQLLAALGL